MERIVLKRQGLWWTANGAQTAFPSKMKARQVVKTMGKPNRQLGISTESLGPACKAVCGDVCWLRPGFH